MSQPQREKARTLLRCPVGPPGWACVLNTHFWFDPAKDVAGVIMTQTLPFVEPRFMAVYEQFERAVYAAR